MTSHYDPVDLPHRVSFSDDEILSQSVDFLNHIKKRSTVRDYSDRPVAQGVIENCILAAGSAPSGANQQPWHFVAISDPEIKRQIRSAAEEEERKFYGDGAPEEWLNALEPLGTDVSKPHLEDAPWLIAVFAQRWGVGDNGEKIKHYYVPESVGIASGMLLTALHTAGLVTLTHTPNPMKFLAQICNRPEPEKPVMIIAVGHPKQDATVPKAALEKKPLGEIMTVL